MSDKSKDRRDDDQRSAKSKPKEEPPKSQPRSGFDVSLGDSYISGEAGRWQGNVAKVEGEEKDESE